MLGVGTGVYYIYALSRIHSDTIPQHPAKLSRGFLVTTQRLYTSVVLSRSFPKIYPVTRPARVPQIFIPYEAFL